MKNLSVLTALAVTIGLGIFVLTPDEAPAVQDSTAVSSESVQPIVFPHNTHVDTYQMDCMYCHFSADRSVDAGIPPVDLCMGCHTLVAGQNNPEEVAKLVDYYNRGESIPWVRIYKISDHAHFPHMRHINAGLDCTECHGDVPSMGPIEERDPAWGGDNMGWCVSCHVEQEARRDCTVCHY
jgi:hypothetical protein